MTSLSAEGVKGGLRNLGKSPHGAHSFLTLSLSDQELSDVSIFSRTYTASASLLSHA